MLSSQIGIEIYFRISIPRKSTKVHIFKLGFPTLNEGQNSSKYHKNKRPCLSLKWVSKSTFKIYFEKLEKMQRFTPYFD